MKTNLSKLGICINLPVQVIMAKDFSPASYGCSQTETERIMALRDVVTEYLAPDKTETIHGPEDALSHLKQLRLSEQEEVWAILMNRANKVISTEQLFKGGLSTAPIDNRVIIKKALDLKATSLILAHNHPSGSPKPSKADIEATEKLKKACKVMDMELTDHIIISRASYFSFANETEIIF